MNINKLFEQLTQRQSISTADVQYFIHQCMKGELSDVQIAVFLALMRMKGETVDELTAAATTMREHARLIDLGDHLVDIVGTGGDNKNTFNVSTICSFVTAAAGVKIAKHGNHSVSSNSGSADFLIQAGFKLNLSDASLRKCVDNHGIAFLFAPHFHTAMRHVRGARKQLGIRTLFNLLGPLLNPASVKNQVVGVYTHAWLKPVASVLANLGSKHVLVINSRDGMDEISIAAPTDVIELSNGNITEWVIDPADYGCAHTTIDDIVVDKPAQSIALATSVFAGEKGAARDMILLNTASALYCAGASATFGEGIEKAAFAIDSGEAGKRFEQLKSFTQRESEPTS